MNLFSSAILLAGLVVSRELWEVLAFIVTNRSIVAHNSVMSFCLTVGQLCMFAMIRNLGALVFTTGMIVHQFLPIVLSNLALGHRVQPEAWVGVGMVFFALFAQQTQRCNRKACRTGEHETLVLGQTKA